MKARLPKTYSPLTTDTSTVSTLNPRLHALLSILFVLCSLFLALTSSTCAQRVRVGAEILLEKHLGLLQNRNIGVICNHTSVLPNGTHLVDTLLGRGIKVTALFSPEHGIRGTAAAGEDIGDSLDEKTGIQIYSLYGKNVKPTASMLRNIDVLVFDLQDVGTRFYTYQSTLAKTMEAAAEHHKKLVVLDRPDPINADDFEGPVLDTTLKSFVGLFPIPVRTGITIGELAKMIAGEWWHGEPLDLNVIAMDGWKRSMWYDETGLPWISPSPNMRSLATATVYPGTCIFEATNVSEGRGTDKPFEYIGAPWINGDTLAKYLSGENLEGVRFLPIQFEPLPDPAAAPDPKYKNQTCRGVFVWVKDRNKFHPTETGIAMVGAIRRLYPDSLKINSKGFDRLIGHSEVREQIQSGSAKLLYNTEYKKRLAEFEHLRSKYAIY